LNEAENIPTLIREIEQAGATSPVQEIIYVDDGSTDATLETLLSLRATCPMLRIVRHDRACGQSAAFHSGARIATQDLLVFMDGDLQNDPEDIALLFCRYQMASEGKRLAVLGQRAVRHDSGLRRISSRLANGLRASVLHDGTRDTGCSLKMIRREDFLNLPYFDHMHRFLPALLIRDGVQLAHVQVSHRARIHGRSKYGFWNRALVGAVDLLGVAWLVRRRLPADVRPREITEVEKR
jgi:dolichol-phosphate mannosyltransferase